MAATIRPGHRWGCGTLRGELPWIDPSVLSRETFRSRTGFVAAVGLILVAASSVLFVLLDGQGERIAAAAGLFALALAIVIPFTIRGHRRERQRQADLDRSEARYRA